MARKEIQKDLPLRYLFDVASGNTVAGDVNFSLGATVLKPLIYRYTYNNQYVVLKKIHTLEDYYTRFLTRSDYPNSRPTHFVERGVDS
ncbi:MAG: hypothetical protein AABY22_01710, partial [Nanoarchaeota archaeon]